MIMPEMNRKNRTRFYSFAAAVISLLFVTAQSPSAENKISLKQATGRGVFNIGPSKGTLTPVADEGGHAGEDQATGTAKGSEAHRRAA